MPDTTFNALSKLNSMTKYPSIPTYHTLDPSNGNLTMPPLDVAGDVTATEKVDGTNARIILTDGGYYLGSREELLHWADDRVWNPAQSIVEAIKPIAERLRDRGATTEARDAATILFGEVFGGKTTANAKQYTGERRVGWRLFDVVLLPGDHLHELLTWPPERIAAWRDGGGQPFLDQSRLDAFASTHDLELVPTVWTSAEGPMPTTIDEMASWLRDLLPATRVALDDQAGGRAEGIVVRAPDRSLIAKLRLEDYQRTLRRRR